MHAVEQVPRNDDFVLVRKEAVLFRACHAPIKGNLKRQLVGVSESIQQESAKMIASSEKVAASNEKYARAMKRLTGALVFVGLLQVGVLVWQTLYH